MPLTPDRQPPGRLISVLPAILLAALLLVSCGGGSGSGGVLPDPDPPPPPAPSGLLIAPTPVNSLADAFARSLSGTLTQESSDGDGAPLLAAPPGLSGDGGGFSTTYRLEAAVDEHDVVKYDGELMLIAPSRGMDCCFLVEPLATNEALLPPPPPSGPREIRMLRTDRGSASASEVGRLPVDEGVSIEGLYLHGDDLIALGSSAWWGQHGDAFASIVAWEGQQLGLRIYDVSNPANPQVGWSLDIEGAMVTSRRVGDSLILISRHFPTVEGLNYAPQSDEERAENQAVLDSVTAADLLPRVRLNDEEVADAVTEENCLVTDSENPDAPASPGHPVITTVMAIDLSERSLSSTLCYAEAADGVYMSENALYLAQTLYDDPDAVDSIIHRIDLADALSYRGSARIAGSLTSRGQADFRMSEWNEVLRVVTTRWQPNEDDAFDHRIFTLEPAADAPELQVLAQFPPPNSDTVIGKPNEDLFGARFLGERAYLVTFERIDPLYVIDLADPAAPSILGELEVTGFSDLLHPVSDNLLLGLGEDENGAVKVELYDVSSPDNPQPRGRLVLAEDANWSWSEARYDRRAFSYLSGDDGSDRFAVPVSASVEDDGGHRQEDRLYMLEVLGKDNSSEASLSNRGAITTPTMNYAPARPRSIIDGDAVYFIPSLEVWGAFWGDEGSASGPY